MRNKYKLRASYVPDSGYQFELDEGTMDGLNFSIDEDDNLTLYYGDSTYPDYEENKKRRLTVIYNNFFKNLLPDISIEELERETLHIDGLFEMVENYIIDRDMYVGIDKLDILLEENSYRICYDKDTGKISYYIKDYRIKDETGIIILPDGTFFPCLSTRFTNLDEKQKDLRKQIIKEFIYDKLKVKINFGRKSDGKLLSIKTLYERAFSSLPINKEEKPYSDSEKNSKLKK